MPAARRRGGRAGSCLTPVHDAKDGGAMGRRSRAARPSAPWPVCPGCPGARQGCCPAAHTGPTIGGYTRIVGRPGSGLGRRRTVDSGQVSCWMGTWAQILPSGHLGGLWLWVAPGKSSRWGEDGLPGRRHDWLRRTPIQRAHARHARPPAVTGTVIHGVPEGATTVPTRQRRLPVLPRVAGPSEAGSATCHRAAIGP